MSKIDYQALREAAEKATPGRVGDRIDESGSIKYECRGYDGSLVLRTDHKNMEYGFIGDNGNADELFFRLCVPDVVLALLDELAFLDKRNTELNSTLERWAVDRAQIASEFNEAEKRIAELEAREVVLPRAHDVHPLGPQSAKIFCEFHRSIVNRCADEIRKVGVKVSIKGN
ncbi:TPA: ead/Ea22-like family protein [Escherichia coli]|uniref:ead/Ea22-like family protein n=1 Tax=Escherichia coli TaxID=562 RepID=UPI001440F511|nr:ead/Ea22-like family protein [Escherichia coli]NKJ62706.1 ead/Ea22-like family protein [Escherichia coli]HAG7206624.1 ead/Ea22-like family protein [Escherichia coli]